MLATLNSERIGSLSHLSIWDWAPWQVALFLFAIDFGVIFFILMGIIERPVGWDRGYFPSFIFNDIIIIPVFGAMATICMRHLDGNPHWYTQRWFHLTALGIGFVLSFSLEVMAVKGGMFTLSQELSPSKLYHTIIFGFMAYWLITGVVAVFSSRQPRWALIVAIVAIGCWEVVVLFLDPMYIKNSSDLHPAHFEVRMQRPRS